MKLFIISLFLLFFTNYSMGQTVIGAVGISSSTSRVILQGTIGESIIATGTSSGAIVTQGFHQSNYDFTTVEENNTLAVQNYPNPTNGITNFESNEPIILTVYNIAGASVVNLSQFALKQTIDLSSFENGTYVVRITSEDKNIYNTYKIIKH